VFSALYSWPYPQCVLPFQGLPRPLLRAPVCTNSCASDIGAASAVIMPAAGSPALETPCRASPPALRRSAPCCGCLQRPAKTLPGTDVDGEILSAHESQMLSAASLVKVALITGDPYMGQLVADLANRLPTTWSKMAHLTASTVGSGLIVAERMDETQHEKASVEAARIANERVEIPAKMRGQRERLILNALRSHTTDIGASLRAAAANDSTNVDAARQLASGLTRGEVGRLVASADRKVGRSGKALPAERIDEIVNILMADRDAIARWASAVPRRDIRCGRERRLGRGTPCRSRRPP
jgi:hypothetical protein